MFRPPHLAWTRTALLRTGRAHRHPLVEAEGEDDPLFEFEYELGDPVG